ncbi:NADPH-dependent FMN reductase [Flavobacterium okayamense]|uniref:FMN reductase n=1 Tax=Flavobacterium okayamense TaxID=2830782 RepID=A0ABN6HYZ7_9FLAO|nr:NAD(P)H-dependent oxidoreductase [Flavobacterium okayamense]BCY28615.1 FMN reductase [Flavobacterium okayamense]
MKIVGFAGSNSSTSINKKLVTYVTSLFANVEVEILDLNDYELPLFGVDLEKEIGQPELAAQFLQKMNSADLLVVSLAENNGNYSVAFKNIFDWASRQEKNVFQGKDMLLMSTSPGGRGGATVLEIAKNSFPRYGANILATFSLPKFYENFNVDENLISNPELQKEIQQIVTKISK